MSTRRLEMSVKKLREQGGRADRRDQSRPRGAEGPGGRAQGQEAGAFASSEARANCSCQREEQMQQLTDKLGKAERMLEKRALELEKLGRMYDDASPSPPATGRSNWWRAKPSWRSLPTTFRCCAAQRKEADKRHQEVVAEGKATRDALKAEKKKNRRSREEARAPARHACRSRGQARSPRKGAGAASRTVEGRGAEAEARPVASDKLPQALDAKGCKLEGDRRATLQMSTLARRGADGAATIREGDEPSSMQREREHARKPA